MSRDLIEKEFNKILPNRKQNVEAYRKFMIAKYGEKRVKELDAISGIVNETVDEALKDLLG